MKLAVCLYKYFAYGGLARDFRRIMEIRRDAGDTIDVYFIEWHGEPISGFNLKKINVSGMTNHARMRDYQQQVQQRLNVEQYDLVIGFNKMPNLDLYYAADPCYLDRVKQHKTYWLTRHFGRVKFYEQSERAVFGQKSHTVSLMISSIQRKLFESNYNTPADQLIDLPPGIDPVRKRPNDYSLQRQQLRDELGHDDQQFLLLMIGSGFHRKGVDYAISALASLPSPLRENTHLYVLGEDNAKPFIHQAAKLNVARQIHFMGGRDDVPQWLLAADLFLHPARSENTGTVILEAMVAGLPSIVSTACGYANYVQNAEAGDCIEDPENTMTFTQMLAKQLNRSVLQRQSQQALAYADGHDLYSMPQKVAEIIGNMALQNKGA